MRRSAVAADDGERPEVKATVAIPARLRSSRLERKLLIEIAGKTLLRRTHEVAVRANCGPVVVLADSEEVAAEVRSFGGEAILTDPGLESGTARIASVVDRLRGDVIVNLQGDAPLTPPEVLEEVCSAAVTNGASVTMPVYRITSPRELADPAVAKVVRSRTGRVVYVSRSPIPHLVGEGPARWPAASDFWAHAGIYAYSRAFLQSFPELPASLLEQAERLEQLRWLDAGVEVGSLEIASPRGPSVDTPEQLERVRALVG